MQMFSRVLLIMGIGLMSAQANAENYKPIQGKYLWSIGFDVFAMYARPVGDFDNVFERTKQGSTIYFADRFNGPFGFELGYSWTNRPAKGWYVATGETAFNTVATSSENHMGRLRIKGSYIDLHWHVPVRPKMEAKFAFGVGFTRQGISFNNDPNNNDSVQQFLAAIYKKTALTYRFGAGVQALVFDRVGLRGMVYYQTLSQIKVRGITNGISPQILHNGFEFVLGIYYTFTGLKEIYNPQ